MEGFHKKRYATKKLLQQEKQPRRLRRKQHKNCPQKRHIFQELYPLNSSLVLVINFLKRMHRKNNRHYKKYKRAERDGRIYTKHDTNTPAKNKSRRGQNVCSGKRKSFGCGVFICLNCTICTTPLKKKKYQPKRTHPSKKMVICYVKIRSTM